MVATSDDVDDEVKDDVNDDIDGDTLFTAGEHLSNTNLSDLSIVGTCDIFVANYHVIHPIG